MAPRERHPLGPGDRLGDFVIGSRLGRGGMGEVWAAEQTSLGRQVALKLISAHLADSEEFRARFEREARALALLDSPYVVTVHTSGDIDGQVYLATQLVPDGDLGSLLEREGPLAVAVALHVVEQVARGLADVHRIGLVHRDIKPSNVLLDGRESRWHALLGDFGVVRETAPGSDITLPGAAVGTPAYMAPELHLGATADESSDLYALGCLLWAALSGRAPYVGTSQYAVVHAHLHAPVPQLRGPGVEPVNAVLRAALAKDRAARPAGAAVLADALAAARAALSAEVARRPAAVPPAPAQSPATAVAGSPPPPRSHPSPQPPTRGPRRGPSRVRGPLVVAAAVVLVAAVALGVVLLRDRVAPPAEQGVGEPEPPGASAVADPPRGAGSLDDDARLVRDTAQRFVDSLNTYGPDLLADDGTMPGYRQRVLGLVTPGFAVQFEGSVKVAEQSVAQGGYRRTYDGFGVGVTRLDDDAAVVVVGGSASGEYTSISGANPDTTAPPEAVRVVVDLVRGDDGWLVDDFRPAASGAGPAAEPDRQAPFVQDAVDAAVEAVPDVLGYDHRDLDGALAGAHRRMTDDFAAQFDRFADTVLREQAPATRTSVAAVGVGAGAASVGSGVVSVLVFVDFTITSAGVAPAARGDVYRITMAEDADAWLVDGLDYESVVS